MEAEIKRVNFFDGQFLQEAEFRVEQQYHMHMRRRVNFMLFESPGVIPGLESGGNDLEFDVIDPIARTFRVRPGTAIALVPDPKEGKEIILRAPSDPVTIGPAIGPTAPAFIVLRQSELASANPPSAGGVPGDTRVEERYDLLVEAAWPPAVLPPDFAEHVLLGTLTFNAATNLLDADYGAREVARLRSSLIGASPVGASITSISTSTILAGSTVSATIVGTNLGGATAVTFSGTGVTAAITGGNATSVNVDITATGAAPAGARTFIVNTPAGNASSAGIPAAAFAVSVPTPVTITSTQPPAIVNLPAALPRGTMIVLGTNLRNPALNNGDPAAGTTVRFVAPADPTTVLAPCPNPVVLSNVGATQRVQFETPLESELPGGTTTVRVQVEFGGATGEAPGTLTVF